MSLRQLPFPVIAAINGPAIGFDCAILVASFFNYRVVLLASVGAGLCVALACDIRVASVSAKMGLTFVSLGLHPGMGATHFLPLLVGEQQAAKLLLTGDVITGFVLVVLEKTLRNKISFFKGKRRLRSAWCCRRTLRRKKRYVKPTTSPRKWLDRAQLQYGLVFGPCETNRMKVSQFPTKIFCEKG